MSGHKKKTSEVKHAMEFLSSAELYVESLDAQACYIDDFDSGEPDRQVPDITRVYRVMTRGVTEMTNAYYYDLVARVHRNKSGMVKATYGSDHVCTDRCRDVIPVVPVGWEDLLIHIYRWWNWEGNKRFFNDGSLFIQDANEVSEDAKDSEVKLEVITTYDQILELFPVKVIRGIWYLP